MAGGPNLIPGSFPRGLSSTCLSTIHSALLSNPLSLHGSVTTPRRGTSIPCFSRPLLVGGSTGMCIRLALAQGSCGGQGGFLGRQHKSGAAGDGGVDDVHQSVGLITPLEGQLGCHVGTEGQQPTAPKRCRQLQEMLAVLHCQHILSMSSAEVYGIFKNLQWEVQFD